MDVSLLVVGGLLIVSMFININLYRKLIYAEKFVQSKDDEMFNVYNFILKALVECERKLNDVDRRGIFKSDDDVGFTFKLIRELIEQTKFKIQQLEKNDEENE